MTDYLTDRDWELLSAFLDGEVTLEEKRRVESRLAADSNFRSAYQSLARTRGILRSVPDVKRRRNFFLNPSMVRPQGWLKILPVLNFSSTIAAVLAVIFFVLNLLPMGARSTQMAPVLVSAPTLQVSYAQPAAAAPAEVQKNLLDQNAPADQLFAAPAAPPTEPLAQGSVTTGQDGAGSMAFSTQSSMEEPETMAAAPPVPGAAVPPPMMKLEEGAGSPETTATLTVMSTPQQMAKAVPVIVTPTGSVDRMVLSTPTTIPVGKGQSGGSAAATSALQESAVVEPTAVVPAAIEPTSREIKETGISASQIGGFLLLLAILLAAAEFFVKRRYR
jgi:hypothetical protein